MSDDKLGGAIVVALGSSLPGNYGSSCAALTRALEGFPEMGVDVKAKSSIWRSLAWPRPWDPPFFNQVCLVACRLTPEALLARLHHLEEALGRRRDVANGPRVVDLDLIAYGRQIRSGEGLILPHPRAAERLFVMGPLAEVAPDWIHPTLGRTARALAAAAWVGRDAAPLAFPDDGIAKSPPSS